MPSTNWENSATIGACVNECVCACVCVRVFGCESALNFLPPFKNVWWLSILLSQPITPRIFSLQRCLCAWRIRSLLSGIFSISKTVKNWGQIWEQNSDAESAFYGDSSNLIHFTEASYSSGSCDEVNDAQRSQTGFIFRKKKTPFCSERTHLWENGSLKWIVGLFETAMLKQRQASAVAVPKVTHFNLTLHFYNFHILFRLQKDNEKLVSQLLQEFCSRYKQD